MSVLDGRVAIVTGASQGIGRGVALALAKEGAAVTAVARTPSLLEELRDEIQAFGGKALAVQCDVSKRDQVDAAVAQTVDEFGRIDILVNNAQWVPPPHPLETWTEAEVREAWESGFLGTFNFMQACFPHMKEQGGGRVINMSSSSGYSGLPMYGGYAQAKEAIRAFSRSAAREWGGHNITVNTISPASLSDNVVAEYPTEESRQMLMDASRFAIRRFGDAEKDIGRAVVYLAGPDAGIVTGCTLSVDAGVHML